MVFTPLQITAFFEEAAQMGLPHRTRQYLQGEGINHPDDLAEFTEKEAWAQIVEACKRPPQVAAPAGGGALQNQVPFQLPAKSLLRLRVAAMVVEYYNRTSRPLTAANMSWTRLANFKIEWDTLVDRKRKNDEHSLPSVSRSLPIVPFFEAYDTFVGEFIGQAGCPLAWIYRGNVAVAGAAPALAADQPYSTAHGSVAEEMVARLSHTHPLYRIDNATGYSQLVTATLGTSYASTIAPFKRSKDGRGALVALKAQFAGPAHWDREVKSMSDFLLTTKWTGTTGFSLHQFLAKHRSAFNSLQRCGEHVAVELPNQRTIVGYLLENIDCNDKDVTAALSHIRLDDTVDATTNTPTGKRNDFEGAVAFLLPTDPIRKKRGGKRPHAHVSSAAITTKDKNRNPNGDRTVRFKPTTGKTGVELRWYKLKEWRKLSQEQQDEVREHRKKNRNYPDSGNKGSKKGGLTEAKVAVMIADAAAVREKELEASNNFKNELISDLKGMVDAQVAAILGSVGGPKKALQRAGTSVAVAAIDAEAPKGVDACAESLMSKFNSMGSKAGKKTG